MTNPAKRHWNSISPTRQARIIREFKEFLQLLCTVDEVRVPAFVRPDEMGDLVDDIETICRWTTMVMLRCGSVTLGAAL